MRCLLGALVIILWFALSPHTDYLTYSGSCRAFELAPGVSVAFCAGW